MTIPVSAIIATRDRPEMLRRTILSVLEQSAVPQEIIVVDASHDEQTKNVLNEILHKETGLVFVATKIPGAASQREQGVSVATQSTIWFLDDDIILEPECVIRLWQGFSFQSNVGAVSSFITNQNYISPGRVTLFMYKLMSNESAQSFAGRIIGPAWNLLPEDREGLPEYVCCEWLNTTCTMYRKDYMPVPVFSNFFKGYSLMEDVELSVTIGRQHVLLNARTARIFHDSQPGSHKANIIKLSSMELVNRHYITTQVLNRRSNGKLFIFETFGIVSTLTNAKGWKALPKVVYGKLLGVLMILHLVKRNF